MRKWVGWSGALAVVLAVAGCSKDQNPSPAPPQQGDGTVKSVASMVSGGASFRVPFDAALSPDGKTAYFTALVDEGAALFKVPAAGGTAAKLADLVSPGPLDVTSDGQTVVVADPGVESDTGALGALVSVSTSGGTPSVLGGTEGTMPRGVAISGGRIVFTGSDPADGSPGVFETSVGGGVTTLFKTGILEPSAVAIGTTGEVYVLDAESDGARTQHVVKIVSGAASEVMTGLRVGFPAGLAVAENGANLLVSSTDPNTGKARLERFSVSGMAAGNPFTGTVGSFDEPAGLHRAAKSDSYAYVDSGASGAGTVFVVNPQ